MPDAASADRQTPAGTAAEVLSVEQFFAQHCPQPAVAHAFAGCPAKDLERGVLFDYAGVRWCAVVLPVKPTFTADDAAAMELDRMERARLRAAYLLVKSLKRDIPKGPNGLPSRSDEQFARFVQSFACPVAGGAAALVWRETADLK